jgi:hypothetical protein
MRHHFLACNPQSPRTRDFCSAQNPRASLPRPHSRKDTARGVPSRAHRFELLFGCVARLVIRRASLSRVAPPCRRERLLSRDRLRVFRFRSWLCSSVARLTPPLHPRPRRSNTHDGVFPHRTHSPAEGRGYVSNARLRTAAASLRSVPWISPRTRSALRRTLSSARTRARVARRLKKLDDAPERDLGV